MGNRRHSVLSMRIYLCVYYKLWAVFNVAEETPLQSRPLHRRACPSVAGASHAETVIGSHLELSNTFYLVNIQHPVLNVVSMILH